MKIALYIAFQNKSSIDCCKEIIDLISESNQLIIDSKVKNELDESRRDNFIFFDYLIINLTFRNCPRTLQYRPHPNTPRFVLQ